MQIIQVGYVSISLNNSTLHVIARRMIFHFKMYFVDTVIDYSYLNSTDWNFHDKLSTSSNTLCLQENSNSLRDDDIKAATWWNQTNRFTCTTPNLTKTWDFHLNKTIQHEFCGFHSTFQSTLEMEPNSKWMHDAFMEQSELNSVSFYCPQNIKNEENQSCLLETIKVYEPHEKDPNDCQQLNSPCADPIKHQDTLAVTKKQEQFNGPSKVKRFKKSFGANSYNIHLKFNRPGNGPTYWGMWEDERNRMVYVSWLPRAARAQHRTEKKQCEVNVCFATEYLYQNNVSSYISTCNASFNLFCFLVKTFYIQCSWIFWSFKSFTFPSIFCTLQITFHKVHFRQQFKS
jgi:hypothetical protein